MLGVRLGAGIFSLFVICGQFVFAAGVFSDLLWLCYVGRFIFGIGGESLAVAQNTYTCRWFSGSTLNLGTFPIQEIRFRDIFSFRASAFNGENRKYSQHERDGATVQQMHGLYDVWTQNAWNGTSYRCKYLCLFIYLHCRYCCHG